MDANAKAVADRIESLQQAIRTAKEYLESGKHADWAGFRPLFYRKRRDGRELPPHKDWVQNVYLPRTEKALTRAEKVLDRLGEEERVRVRDNPALQRAARAKRSL